MVLASNLSVGLRARQTRQDLGDLASWMKSTPWVSISWSWVPVCFLPPCQPTTVPCFLSQRQAFSVLHVKKQPLLPSSKKPTKGTGQDQSSGRKHCYLTRGDVALYSKVKVASGQKQQRVTSKEKLISQPPSPWVHSLGFVTVEEINASFGITCTQSDPFSHRPRVVGG